LEFNYLTTILFLPAVGAIIIAFISSENEGIIKRVAAIFTGIPLILAIYLFAIFDRSLGAAGVIQFEEKYLWIAPLNAHYHLGVDGLSMPLVLLTAFLGFLAVFISWKVHERPREYFAWLLLLETSIIGVFASLDLLLFFIMWEIEVIPMYFLISIWGSGRREYSAIKYVLYTLFGSAFMLAGVLMLYFTTGSLSMMDITNQGLGMVQSVMAPGAIFVAFLIGFAVKLPAFPLHTWLPDAHTDAPTAVSVILAGVLIKMGGYGMIRICVGMFPDVAQEYAQPLIIIALIGILYGAAVTLMQTDIKRMIAYSSISHMGYVLLGIFALGQVSLTGAALQMFSHGVVTGLLFAMAGPTPAWRSGKAGTSDGRRLFRSRTGLSGTAHDERLCRRVPYLPGQFQQHRRTQPAGLYAYSDCRCCPYRRLHTLDAAAGILWSGQRPIQRRQGRGRNGEVLHVRPDCRDYAGGYLPGNFNGCHQARHYANSRFYRWLEE